MGRASSPPPVYVKFKPAFHSSVEATYIVKFDIIIFYQNNHQLDEESISDTASNTMKCVKVKQTNYVIVKR